MSRRRALEPIGALALGLREADELRVAPVWGGPVERLVWPFGSAVRERDGLLVVTDLFGTDKARENDRVRLGGGETASGTWGVCGQVEAEPQAAATLAPPGPTSSFSAC